jgi:hypothetical protein
MDKENMIRLSSICNIYEVKADFLRSLVDYGLIEIIREDEEDFIHSESLSEMERLMHLHYDLEINMEGIDAISHLLHRVRDLQTELNSLRNRLG